MYRYILVYVGLYRYHTIAWYIPVHTGTYLYELCTYHWSGFQMLPAAAELRETHGDVLQELDELSAAVPVQVADPSQFIRGIQVGIDST